MTSQTSVVRAADLVVARERLRAAQERFRQAAAEAETDSLCREEWSSGDHCCHREAAHPGVCVCSCGAAR